MEFDYDIFTLKSDIQRCIANNNTHFKSNYNILLFDGESDKEYLKTLGALDNLYITPANSTMELTGAIAKDLLDVISDEEIKQIRKNVFLTDSMNLAAQMLESKKSEAQKNNEKLLGEMKLADYLDELENKSNEYREVKLNEKNLMKFIQHLLIENANLNLEYNEHKEMLMLSGEFNSISLNKEQLNLLEACASKVDTFLIAPKYNDDDICESIRVVLSIDLIKED